MIAAGELIAMAQAVRAALAGASGAADGRADAALATLGWRAMLADEPDDAVAIVFRELGAANATATALDDLLAAALGEEPRAGLAVVLPPFAAWAPPGRLDGRDVDALGLATARAAAATELLVVCGTDDDAWAAIVPAAAVASDEIRGIDPAARLRTARVRGRASRATRLDRAVWPSAVALGRRALAHEIEGACRTMLDLARTHALSRAQFGRPIARFQAVRHRLAESLVAVEALEAALAAAQQQPGHDTAALAKAIAGRTASAVVKHCQQVLAGVGFTTEHPFHRHAKRVLLLDGVLGSADRIVLDTGRRLLAARRVPTLVEL